MNDRSLEILIIIIKEHIKTGAPVSSSVLVKKYKLGVSPATVRNIMVGLEMEGLIAQPHISAGRVPTEAAYKLYLEDLKNKKLSPAVTTDVSGTLKDISEQSFKDTAKVVSILSGSAIFWAFNRNSLFFTGISNLFQQPEFSQLNVIQDLSLIIDQMEDIIDNVYDDIDRGISVRIGRENPFGVFCSTVFLKYKTAKNVGVCGILGPLRMDYEKNIALVKFIDESIKKMI